MTRSKNFKWSLKPLFIVVAWSHPVMLSQIVFVTTAFLLVSTALYRRRYARGLSYPPGPKRRFFAGNSRDIPKDQAWMTYTEWKKTYGDVIYVTKFGFSIVILNSSEACNDLLDKRGSIYSDRPRFTMVNELMGWEWALSLMPYGNRFLTHRKIVQQQFQANVVVQSHQPIITAETRTLLASLASSPEDFVNHIEHTARSIIVMATYGHRVIPQNDEFVTLAEKVKSVGVDARKKGPYFVDIFPLLKHVPTWIPGARFKRDARDWAKVVDQMRRRPYEMVKKQMAEGTAAPSMVTSLLDSNLTTGIYDTEDVIMNCAGVVYGAGADTTIAALTNFFLAMQLYPDVQKMAQREIDALTEGRRLPEFSDRTSLPYIGAIVKENSRWHPVTPLGSRKGMFIPRGATVLSNVWAIVHDKNVYENPDEFLPERFLLSDTRSIVAPDPNRVAFGFGRRICPGRYLADAVV
ncbi:cytochrome P450 [Gautieria morchelliformis]|nr:cytochrome P450 [Gautieria morchelliformis]